MRRPRPAQVILTMLVLPLLLAGLAMLALPGAPGRLAGPSSSLDDSAQSSRRPARHHASYFTLVPRSLMP